MAQLGFRTFDEMIGRVDKLDMVPAINHWKAKGIDLSRLLYQEPPAPGVAIYHCETQNHGLDKALDNELIALSEPALERREPVRIERPIRNIHRTVGAMLSGQVARRYGHAGLPEDTIWARFNGTAGGSFGAFLAHGVTLELYGDANDYVGKGLSGGVTVVEGTGDHGCEYMTGGVVVVLGETGRNFAAGMSGGIAYVYDPKGRFASLCNHAGVDLEAIGDEPDEGEDDADGADRPRQRAPNVVDNGMGDPLRFDAERLRILIERHHLFTGSARARMLLGHWDRTLAAFVKVTPQDYRRALLELKAERETAAARMAAAE